MVDYTETRNPAAEAVTFTPSAETTEFDRFSELARRLVAVPKSEIDEQRAAEKKRKKKS